MINTIVLFSSCFEKESNKQTILQFHLFERSIFYLLDVLQTDDFIDGSDLFYRNSYKTTHIKIFSYQLIVHHIFSISMPKVLF